MMRIAILSLLFGVASAFAPTVVKGPTSFALNAKEKSAAFPFLPAPPNLKGYVGDVGFDPLRISDYFPMDYLREAELKHGRICMLAWLGFVAVDCGFRIYPTPELYVGVSSINAHNAACEFGAMGNMGIFIAIFEMVSWLSVQQMLQGSGREAGDYGFDPLGILKDKPEEEVNRWKLRELKNGRLAMLAFSGVVTQAVLTQGPFPYTGPVVYQF